MSLDRKDIRAKLDPDLHAALHVLCDIKYRVLRGRYAGQIVAIVKRNGSAVRVATIGVPAVEFWTGKNNL